MLDTYYRSTIILVTSSGKKSSNFNKTFLIDKDNTVNIIFVFIAVLVGFVILWLVLYRKQDTEKPVAYVCTRCGGEIPLRHPTPHSADFLAF